MSAGAADDLAAAIAEIYKQVSTAQVDWADLLEITRHLR